MKVRKVSRYWMLTIMLLTEGLLIEICVHVHGRLPRGELGSVSICLTSSHPAGSSDPDSGHDWLSMSEHRETKEVGTIPLSSRAISQPITLHLRLRPTLPHRATTKLFSRPSRAILDSSDWQKGGDDLTSITGRLETNRAIIIWGFDIVHRGIKYVCILEGSRILAQSLI